VTVQIFDTTDALLRTAVSDEDGHYLFTGLSTGAYYLVFSASTNYVPTTPQAGDTSLDSDPATNGVTSLIHMTAPAFMNNIDAGYQEPSPTSSGVDLQAYRGADGVYVEFVAYDVEGDGYMTLYLIGPDGWPIWEGTTEVTASPRQVCRFRVPDHLAEVGGTYAFVVRDEVGKIWRAPAVTVKPFAAEMIRMSLVGVTLAFDSLPDREYEIQWTRRLGTPWQTVTNVPSQGKRTTVVVPHPDSTSPSGFFRIVVQ